MKKNFTLVCVGLISLVMFTGTTLYLNSRRHPKKIVSTQDSSRATPKKIGLAANADFGGIPLYFIPNRGQVDPKALYYAKAQNYTLWLTKDELIFDHSVMECKEKPETHIKPKKDLEKIRLKRNVSRLHFVGCNANPEFVPIKRSEYRVNYFKGKNPGNWVKNIPTSQAVLYKNLYDRIDLKVYGNGTRLEYDWIVRPGGDPDEIELEFSTTKSCALEQEGNISIITEGQKILHNKPRAYQMIGGEKNEVPVSFSEVAENRFGFAIGEYDPGCPLIIDPLVLVYSTFLGGAAREYGFAIAVDKTGAFYVAGQTFPQDYPKTLSTNEDIYVRIYSDIFVTKFHPSGSNLEYSTYIGGELDDTAKGIAVDENGYAYITGYTDSPDFPTTPGAFDETYSKHPGNTYYMPADAFVTKLNASGSRLMYSTFLGGYGWDGGDAICIDSKHAVYVTGSTTSYKSFPTTKDAFATQKSGRTDAFVTKLNPAGTKLGYSTYLGGKYYEYGYGIAVDSVGCAYVTGETTSSSFPTTPGAFDTTRWGKEDVFITKMAPNGSRLEYSTFIGGSLQDTGYGIFVDQFGSAYVTGGTRSPEFPTTTDFIYGSGYRVFITKLNPLGNSIEFSVVCSGGGCDIGRAIALNHAGSIFVTGSTEAQNFPTSQDAFSRTPSGKDDSFLIKLDTSGTSILYSTYLGGESIDSGEGIAVDDEGSVYIAGTTYSKNFPTKNAYEDTYIGGLTDCFVAKFEDSEDTIPPEISISNPNEGDVVSRSVSVEAQAFDNHYVLKVDFYIDSVLISTDSTKPYGFSWETLHYKNGPHKISAIASDLTRNSSSDAIEVIVHDLKTNPWWDFPRKPEQRRLPVLLLFPSFLL